MTAAVHRFADSKARGDAGEARIAAHYGGRVVPDRHVPWDLVIPFRASPLTTPPQHPNRPAGIPASDLTVELKTDSYDPAQYLCAFIERWTQRPDGSKIPGGPWRAMADGVDAFAYYYSVAGLVVWLWNLPEVCRRLDAAVLRIPRPAWRRIGVLNVGGYRAIGRLVPRDELEELAHPYHTAVQV